MLQRNPAIAPTPRGRDCLCTAPQSSVTCHRLLSELSRTAAAESPTDWCHAADREWADISIPESLRRSSELQRHCAAKATFLGSAGCWIFPVGLLLLSTHLPGLEQHAHQHRAFSAGSSPTGHRELGGKKDIKALSKVWL